MIAQVSTEWQQENQLYLMQHLDRLRFALERAAGGREGEVWKKREEVLSNTSQIVALEKICQSFGLSTFERDILLLCAGVELDASFGSLIADIQGDSQRNYPTFSLALAVLESAYWGALTPESPLRKWRLIEIGGGNTLTTSPLRIDEKILHYLTGIYHLDSRLKGIATLINTEEQLVPSHQQLAMQMVNTWYLAAPEQKILPILQLCGNDSTSQRAIASTICSKIDFLPYTISVELLPNETEHLNSVKSLWEREFTLNNAALLLEWDNYDGNDPKQERAINQFIETIQAPVIIISQERRRQRHRSIITFDVDSPTSTEQRLLWQQSLKEFAPDISSEVENLVSHFNLSTPAIRSACLKARSIGKEGGVWGERGEGEEGEVISQSSHTSHTPHTLLWDICRTQARPRLDELAQRMDSGGEWDDLVLPAMEKQVLRDAADQLRQRTKVYEEWGFGGKGKRGLGISALFAGGSGTGKTMAAEVLAQEMRLDLYRIDLSAVVSKYIGETEKNLGRVFDAAETGGVILLFDEADAIFGKRSEVKDARDRHANMEVAYLLQRMEAYPGLSILTTNLKNSIDQAFLRRIRFIVQFSFPDANQRAEIWRRVFPKNTPTEGLDARKLARLNVAGGNIRNIALNAAFIAAQAGEVVQMQHILQAAKSEYTKMERPLTDAEIKGWV
ncbi:AAA ATPase central domain-containing protein [Calothrix parasitica NIES-267]|uniref:AAA ATPase central domain-containing protein n=1 Tax=Calothrix parasitica NIES-267 TaxID=1973488 RepID=A0A1Z4LK00_9CYAN|nr:AAA ATPase central domain-containing protein [Calothrix parasitica NIES-267]